MKMGFRKLMAVLAAVMLLAMSIPLTAMAYTGDTAVTNDVMFDKILTTALKKANLGDIKFQFELTPGEATNTDVAYSSNEANISDGKVMSPAPTQVKQGAADWADAVTKDGAPYKLELTGWNESTGEPNGTNPDLTDYTLGAGYRLSFDSIGQYTYTLTETNLGDPTITYSKAEYLIKVDVKNKYGTGDDVDKVVGIEVGEITIIPVKNDAGETVTDAAKITEIKYPNTQATGNLDISKTVAGAWGDVTKTFNYTLTIDKPDDHTTAYTYDLVTNSTGIGHTATATTGNPTSVTEGTPVEFSLKHGEKLTVQNLPAGATFTVTETDSGAYDKSVTYNGGVFTDGNTATITAGINTMAYTNTLIETNTGIATDVLPFVLMFLLAAAGAAFLVIEKRRKAR